MKRISDILTDFLVEHTVTHVFMAQTKASTLQTVFSQHPQLEMVLTQPAQACLIAATAYASLTQRPALVCMAPGAGVSGALSVLYGACREGKPLLVMSSEADFQVATDDGLLLHPLLTRYVVNLCDPQLVLYELQKALHIATTGHPGPVWVNIAPALLSHSVDETTLRHYAAAKQDAAVMPLRDDTVSADNTDAAYSDYFSDVLREHLADDQIIVTTPALPMMAATAGQRLLSSRYHDIEGYELPAAIGACFGSGRKKIVCITTRDSLQQNGQALATVRHYQLPIKLFVLSPSSQAGSLFAPDFEKMTDAYEMQYVRAESSDELNNTLAYALSTRRPTLCEIVLPVEDALLSSPIAQAG